MRRNHWRANAAAGAVVVCAAALAAACQWSGEITAQRRASMAMSPGSMDTLRSARIVFVHQSVGDDIVQGLAALGGLQIVSATQVDAAGPFFAHGRLGRNGDPRSKTDAFVELLEAGVGGRVDVACHKYCFADIDERTDVDALFAYYRRSMVRLHDTFPALTLVHMTTPLQQAQTGVWAEMKKIFGRMPDQFAENVARERFNDLLRREYGGREPLFDLAALEASVPGGGPQYIRFGGARGRALLPQYTSDGGHLNEQGRDRIARELVEFLGRVVADRTAAPAPLR